MVELDRDACSEGGGVKGVKVVSSFSMDSSDGGESHGGGTILARRCRLRSKASQRGTEARYGGCRVGMGPCEELSANGFHEDPAIRRETAQTEVM